MDKTLANILGQGLPPELMETLQDAFDKKVAEAREEAEMAIREEFSRRYDHDKDQLIEAMDRAMTDSLKVYEQTKVKEVKKLREAQEKFHGGLKEARKTFRQRTKEHLEKTNKFVVAQLAEEVKALRTERRGLAEARIRAAEEVVRLKTRLSEAHNAHVKKIDDFAVSQISRELNEFNQERRALVETRAKLVAESKRRLKETQIRFVKESASKMDSFVTKQLANEMSQLHEDLERNRQNNFGRKMFEAMAAEFMASYFADGTESKKLQESLASVKSELSSAKQRLAEAEAISETASRKTRLAEERAERAKVMSELLSNLRGEKRAFMESMLDSVKTNDLRKSFERFLPLTESSVKGKLTAAQPQQKTLVENHTPRVVTGDQRIRQAEVASTEQPERDELATVLHLAGIHKN